jgi:hypothetical protein
MATFSDDFNRANGAPGANWAQTSTWNGGSLAIDSNVLDGGSVAGINNASVDYTGSLDGDDIYAQAAVGNLGWFGPSYWVGVKVRSSGNYNTGTDSRSFYYVVVKLDAGGAKTTELGKQVSGTNTVIHSEGVSWSNGDILRLEVSGTSLSVWQNGSELTNFASTDASISSGTVGVIGDQVGTIDDFEGGDLGGGGSVVQQQMHIRLQQT